MGIDCSIFERTAERVVGVTLLVVLRRIKFAEIYYGIIEEHLESIDRKPFVAFAQ